MKVGPPTQLTVGPEQQRRRHKNCAATPLNDLLLSGADYFGKLS